MENKAEDIANFFEKYKPYIAEIRRSIFVIILFFAIGSVLGFIYSQKIISFILHLYNFKGITVMTTSPYQYIDMAFSMSFITGFLLALPYTVFKSFQFFKPALTTKEKKLLTTFAPISLLLFITGTALGTWIIQYLINFYATAWTGANINSLWDIQHFFSQVILTSILTGLIFQIPIIITFLIKLHIVKRDMLVKKRRFVYVILLIIAVLLPPTDIFSLIILTLPLFFLFEFGLLLNRRT